MRKNRAVKGCERRDQDDMRKAADGIAKIVEDEVAYYKSNNVDDPRAHVFLAGKSQGAMLSLHVQLLNLKEPIGAVGVFSGHPTCPLEKMLLNDMSAEEARSKLSCRSKDMRFFFWHGDKDKVFKQPKTFNMDKELFSLLGLSDTIDEMHMQHGIGHTLTKEGMDAFQKKYIIEKDGEDEGNDLMMLS